MRAKGCPRPAWAGPRYRSGGASRGKAPCVVPPPVPQFGRMWARSVMWVPVLVACARVTVSGPDRTDGGSAVDDSAAAPSDAGSGSSDPAPFGSEAATASKAEASLPEPCENLPISECRKYSACHESLGRGVDEHGCWQGGTILRCFTRPAECDPRPEVLSTDGDCHAFYPPCSPEEPVGLVPRVDSRCGAFEQLDGPACQEPCVEEEIELEKTDAGLVLCAFPVSDAPGGTEFIATHINVSVRVSGGEERVLGYVGDEAGCTAEGGGWRFDDPDAPVYVLLCPATCDALAREAAVTVLLSFPCRPVEVPP